MVDLGVRGLLFALLTKDLSRMGSDSPGGYEFAVFSALRVRAAEQSYGDADLAIALFIDALNRAKPKGEVPIANLGLLVRFRDPNDPTTVERVDPHNLAASFGVGVRLVHATVEITDDPLTTGIEKKLPWLVGGELGTPLKKYVGPTRPAADVPQIDDLTDGDFLRFMQ